MRQPPNAKQSFSPTDKTKIITVVLLLAVLLVVLGILLGIVIKRSGFSFSVQSMLTQPTPTNAAISFATSPPAAIAPTVPVPVVVCGSPTFELGVTIFQIQNLSIASDGSLSFPLDTVGVAYWLESVDGNQLIALSPTPDNISLETTIMAETIAKIILADCSSKTFGLSVPETNLLNVSMLSTQLTSGLTIFFQTDTAGNGLIVRGELTEMSFPQ